MKLPTFAALCPAWITFPPGLPDEFRLVGGGIKCLINHIARFARGVVRASVSSCTDGIASGSARWNATRPLALAVAAAALVSRGKQRSLSNSRCSALVRKRGVPVARCLRPQAPRCSSSCATDKQQQASAPSDCSAIGKLDSEPQKTSDVQPLISRIDRRREGLIGRDKKKRAGHASKHHVAGRSKSNKVASAKSDCSRVASLDSQPQNSANVERVDSTEPPAATEASSGDKKWHAAHERKHKGKHHLRRLASSGKGAVKTTSCPGLARFISEAKGPETDPVDTKRRVADARQGGSQ